MRLQPTRAEGGLQVRVLLAHQHRFVRGLPRREHKLEELGEVAAVARIAAPPSPSATCPTAAATNKQVETMPTTGVTGVIFFTTLGNLAFMVMPTKMGANTTCKVETTMPAASTGTTVPKKVLHRKGVMKMAPTVVAVVMSTLKATLPLAINVQRLEAWPPLMLPTKTMPAVKAGSKLNNLHKLKPKAGIMP